MDGDPSGELTDPTGPEPRPKRRFSILRRLALGLLIVVVGALVLSSCLVEPRAVAPFFAPEGRNGPVLVVAHQGGEVLRPSNTMEAFRHAVDLGADVLDTDMHRSSDGVLVLIHDETVDRTSDGTGAVRDLTIEALRQLDFGYRFRALDDQATYPWRGRGLGIVTVEELFAEFGRDVRYGIEIKQTVPEAARELCDLITRSGLEDRVLVSSFAQPNMDVFRLACPEVATSATEAEVRRFVILDRLRLTGFDRPDHDAFQVPESVRRWRLLTDGFLDTAEDWNLPVVPWTVDDPEAMDRLIGDGVRGINTNRPDLLIERLSAEP